MTDGGSGDLKMKLYLAVSELVGPDPINARLHRATQGIHTLLRHDFPSPASTANRFMALRDKLTVDHRFLHQDDPVPVTDEQGAELAKELLAVFAMVCDPRLHLGQRSLDSPAE